MDEEVLEDDIIEVVAQIEAAPIRAHTNRITVARAPLKSGFEYINKDIYSAIGLNTNIVSSLFGPYMAKVIVRCPQLSCCRLDRFIKWFKLDSDILKPLQDSIWSKPGGEKVVLAGGKMIDFFHNKKMSESLNDYDLFMICDTTNIDSVLSKDLELTITGAFSHVVEWASTKNSPYNPIKVQVVTNVYANPEHVIENFDIRACAIACDGKYVYWAKGAFQDLKKKRITMLNPKSNISVWNRILKYTQKGYEISIPDLAIVSVRFLDSIASQETPNQERLHNRDFMFDRVTELQAGDYDALNET